ncbi:uncharacterized protein LOC121420070 [Lytechinus variegatus]|uniref:uncharacterized protein LOC121420070 n=1 Tax=Lytechinus variegatus TaxID=7654 RepID=UPI001BB174FE|nr:uncharacterized protein LOC121420070 [Lytechinus variegatus]
MDDTLLDTESSITIHPEKTDHGNLIQCYISLDGVFVAILTATLRVIGLPDYIIMTVSEELHDGMETNITCRAFNGYPKPLIHWYIGSKNVTDNSSLSSSGNPAHRYDTTSTLSLIPSRFHHGKLLICRAIQPMIPGRRSVNESMFLDVLCEYVIK